MTLREILVLAYPRSWREEYGEELAAILAQRRLTPGVVADVIWNASKQHLLRDEPWKICGAFLFLWTSVGLFVRSGSTDALPLVILFMTGAWTVWRKHSGMLEAARAAVLVAIPSFVPDALSLLLQGPIPVTWSGGTVVYKWGTYISVSGAIKFGWWQYVAMLPLVLALGAMLGLSGALLGKFADGVREGLRG
jgi:hypothetical protein